MSGKVQLTREERIASAMLRNQTHLMRNTDYFYERIMGLEYGSNPHEVFNRTGTKKLYRLLERGRRNFEKYLKKHGEGRDPAEVYEEWKICRFDSEKLNEALFKIGITMS
ncbi:hypothetical protein [Borrelia sp. RT5S]|uniref:hypothetical protein n=1 Tax=Borrelia sp. RT5S TaxID=2898581 RepID=UPI001E39A693|nr:hypothetical protein [Borrelia sp. RT5S]UGQ16656.1 hypothetical protein LSO06_04895 [Borrelia sp. RT5S]